MQKKKKKSPECRKKRKQGKFFLKALDIQSTVSHLRALTSLEIRVFLNPNLLQEHGAWVSQAGISVLSKELIWQMSQTTQKARVYLTPMRYEGATRSKSHSADLGSCVCCRACFRRIFEMQISSSSILPMGCFFPTSWMFPCPQLTRWTAGGCVFSSTTQGRLQPQRLT